MTSGHWLWAASRTTPALARRSCASEIPAPGFLILPRNITPVSNMVWVLIHVPRSHSRYHSRVLGLNNGHGLTAPLRGLPVRITLFAKVTVGDAWDDLPGEKTGDKGACNAHSSPRYTHAHGDHGNTRYGYMAIYPTRSRCARSTPLEMVKLPPPVPLAVPVTVRFPPPGMARIMNVFSSCVTL